MQHRAWDYILLAFAEQPHTIGGADDARRGRARTGARSVLGVGVRPIWDSKLTLRVLLVSALCGAVVAWAEARPAIAGTTASASAIDRKKFLFMVTP